MAALRLGSVRELDELPHPAHDIFRQLRIVLLAGPFLHPFPARVDTASVTHAFELVVVARHRVIPGRRRLANEALLPRDDSWVADVQRNVAVAFLVSYGGLVAFVGNPVGVICQPPLDVRGDQLAVLVRARAGRRIAIARDGCQQLLVCGRVGGSAARVPGVPDDADSEDNYLTKEQNTMR